MSHHHRHFLIIPHLRILRHPHLRLCPPPSPSQASHHISTHLPMCQLFHVSPHHEVTALPDVNTLENRVSLVHAVWACLASVFVVLSELPLSQWFTETYEREQWFSSNTTRLQMVFFTISIIYYISHARMYHPHISSLSHFTVTITITMSTCTFIKITPTIAIAIAIIIIITITNNAPFT